MSSCDLSYAGEDNTYNSYFYEAKHIKCKKIFECCECKKIFTKTSSYKFDTYHIINDSGTEKKLKTLFMCKDCYSLFTAFNISSLEELYDVINNNLHHCLNDLSIEFFDKLTPLAREFIEKEIEELGD